MNMTRDRLHSIGWAAVLDHARERLRRLRERAVVVEVAHAPEHAGQTLERNVEVIE